MLHVQLRHRQFQFVSKIGIKGGGSTVFRSGYRLGTISLSFHDGLDHRVRIEDVIQVLDFLDRRTGLGSSDGLNEERLLAAPQWRIIDFEFPKQFVLEVETRSLGLGGARRRGITLNRRLEADDPGKFRQRIIVCESITLKSTAVCGLFLYHY